MNDYTKKYRQLAFWSRIPNPFLGQFSISPVTKQSDREAIASDWKVVGDDLKSVMK